MNLDLTPITFQQWNPEFPLKSFQFVADFIHDTAKRLLVDHRTDPDMLLFFPQTGGGHMATVSDTPLDRNALSQLVKDYINQNYIYGFIHACVAHSWTHGGADMWVVKSGGSGDAKAADVKPMVRQDWLSVSAESRCGFSFTWLDEIIRDGKKDAISLGKCQGVRNIHGRFGKVFG